MIYIKDGLFDRIEHPYLFKFFNLIVNSYFLISNPHKYHIWNKTDRVV